MTCHFKLFPFWKRLVGMTANGSGIAEGRDLKDKSFSLVQMPNRCKND